jgi:hypothetical protein
MGAWIYLLKRCISKKDQISNSAPARPSRTIPEILAKQGARLELTRQGRRRRRFAGPPLTSQFQPGRIPAWVSGRGVAPRRSAYFTQKTIPCHPGRMPRAGGAQVRDLPMRPAGIAGRSRIYARIAAASGHPSGISTRFDFGAGAVSKITPAYPPPPTIIPRHPGENRDLDVTSAEPGLSRS